MRENFLSTYYLDQLLLHLGFSVVKDTNIGMFAYIFAAIFVISCFLLIINFLLKIISHDYTYTTWTWILLIIIAASGTIYWAAVKIPYTVMMVFPILKPQM